MAKSKPVEKNLDEVVPAKPFHEARDFDEESEIDLPVDAGAVAATSPLISHVSNPNPRLEPAPELPPPTPLTQEQVKQQIAAEAEKKPTGLTLPPNATIKTVGETRVLDLGDAPAPVEPPKPFVAPPGTSPWYFDASSNPTPIAVPVAVVYAKDLAEGLKAFCDLSGVGQLAAAPSMGPATPEQVEKFGPKTA